MVKSILCPTFSPGEPLSREPSASGSESEGSGESESELSAKSISVMGFKHNLPTKCICLQIEPLIKASGQLHINICTHISHSAQRVEHLYGQVLFSCVTEYTLPGSLESTSHVSALSVECTAESRRCKLVLCLIRIMFILSVFFPFSIFTSRSNPLSLASFSRT